MSLISKSVIFWLEKASAGCSTISSTACNQAQPIQACKNIHFFLVSYLLWRQLGLKKKQYSGLFNTERKNGNDATVLRLIEIFAEERKS